MTAGVQTIDSAAYLPPPPSSSTPDAKTTGAAGNPGTNPQAAGTPGEPSDFQSELAMQQSAQHETDPAGRIGSAQIAPTQHGPIQPGPIQIGSTKTGSSKSGKKLDARTDNSNPAAVTPVQVTEPQKPILPFSLALAQPQEDAKLDQNAQPGDKATLDEIAQGTAQQAAEQQQPAQVLSPSLLAVATLPELRQPVALKQFMKVRQSAQPVEAPSNQTATDPGKVPVLPLAPVPAVTQDVPMRQEGKRSEDPASQDQAITATNPGASSNSHPVSIDELKLPAAPAEPIASAVQGPGDTAPSSPSALAFAARVSVAQAKLDQPITVNPSQSLAVSGSQTSAQIPVRYAATAQIIQSAAAGTKEDEAKKDIGAAFDQSARADAHADIRTDMVTPRLESAPQPSPASAPAAPQQAAPSAQLEHVIEPPAVAPTSSKDIRVEVPDAKGGSTQVRFVESGGEVRVSVRTADDGLAQNLRTHLNDLTQRLSDGGMPAEIWKPVSNAASSQNDPQQSQQDGRGSGGQGSGGQGGQQDRQQKRPAWLDEMEASLHGEQN